MVSPTFTPAGYVSLDLALVYVFAMRLQDASDRYLQNVRDLWSFKIEGQCSPDTLWRRPGISIVVCSEGKTKRLLLRPPLRDILPSYRECFCQEMLDENVCVVRRALSAGWLRSFVIGVDGDMLPLPARFWNTSGAEAVLTEEGRPYFESIDGSRGPEGVFLLINELDAWLGLLGDLPVQEGKSDPVQVCAAWLSDKMKCSPTSSPPKPQLRKEAITKFEGLSWRGFDRAWDVAKANNPTATGWGLRGRKSAAEIRSKFAAIQSEIRSNSERNSQQNN